MMSNAIGGKRISAILFTLLDGGGCDAVYGVETDPQCKVFVKRLCPGWKNEDLKDLDEEVGQAGDCRVSMTKAATSG